MLIIVVITVVVVIQSEAWRLVHGRYCPEQHSRSWQQVLP